MLKDSPWPRIVTLENTLEPWGFFLLRYEPGPAAPEQTNDRNGLYARMGDAKHASHVIRHE